MEQEMMRELEKRREEIREQERKREVSFPEFSLVRHCLKLVEYQFY